MSLNWKIEITRLKGVGTARALLLTKLGIYTVGDLLQHFPRRYEDRSQLTLIRNLSDGQAESFRATVISVDETRPRRGMTITKIMVRDVSGLALLTWFNQPYVKKWYKPGMELVVFGKVQRRYQVEITNPEVEILDGTECYTGCIVPVYSTGENISQRLLRGLVRQALEELKQELSTVEMFSPEVLEHEHLLDSYSAWENIHFPGSMEILAEARRRLVFEELFLLQCGLAWQKQKNKQCLCGIKHGPDKELVKGLEDRLPFSLTDDQRQALREIKADMEDVTPMQRLVQGDVGSGKTVVAALALAKTVENGYQGAMMAPTEILAEQHYQTLTTFLAPLGVRIALLTGKLSRRVREDLLRELADGLVDVVIGTHALIQDDVSYKHLGLVVTDEQHRFGVQQRARLQSKGHMPDVLVMTATPIPRTMALTVYGDLDVSVIRQLPPGRKPVKTHVRGSDRRQLVYKFVIDEVQKGRQAYIVCPLVEESEKIEACAATELYENLSSTYFRNISCGLVHGRLKAQEKEQVMEAFYQGSIKVLITTTVIEVGVNVPNATVMIIEGAERFGLAQLHQLRGRIGRGEFQSHCILLSDSKSGDAMERLQIMTTTSDGFVLAEQDLVLRGAGQLFGSRQHGLPDLKIADIVKDVDILIAARQIAQQTAAERQQLERIAPLLVERFGEQFSLIFKN